MNIKIQKPYIDIQYAQTHSNRISGINQNAQKTNSIIRILPQENRSI